MKKLIPLIKFFKIYNEVDLTYLNDGEYNIGSSAKIYQAE